jgi:hypothetical protein
MGDHYIPRFYLKGFTENPDSEFIYVYEKGKRDGFKANIRKIAQENRFYPEEIEQYLANVIEENAKPAISKIRDLQPISFEDKVHLSKYMMAMLKRVPSHKLKVQHLTPNLTDKIIDDLVNEIKELIRINPEKQELLERRINEALSYRGKVDLDLCELAWWSNIDPDKSPKSTEALSMMTWNLFVRESEPFYLTNDNPVYFFKGIGIGNQESEVSFPISSKVVLWATWRKDLQERFVPARTAIVKEINRRTVSNCRKYVFSSGENRWIFDLMNKSKLKLNRIW